MQHVTNAVFMKRLLVSSVFMKPEATSTPFEKLFAGYEANSPRKEIKLPGMNIHNLTLILTSSALA
jgi:hypothetical protein